LIEDGTGAWEESIEVYDHGVAIDVDDAASGSEREVMERNGGQTLTHLLHLLIPDLVYVNVPSDWDSERSEGDGRD